jgi:hypothetical protein
MDARPKRYLTKGDVALRYANCTKRTVDRMVERGELPPPAFYQGRFPLWDEAVLDAHDAARTEARRAHVAAVLAATEPEASAA